MAQPYRFSPTLLVVSLLAVVAGAGAGLLGVGAPSTPPISVSNHWAFGVPTILLEAILLLPLVALAIVYLLSLSGSAGSGSSARGVSAGLVVLLLLAVGLIVLVVHPAPLAPLENFGRASGGGGGGGSGSGSGPTNHSGGNGSGSGGANNSTNGTGPSHNGTSNNTTGGNGGSGPNGSKNGTNGTRGGGGNSTGGDGGGQQNNSTSLITSSAPPPGLPQWLPFVGVAGAAAVLLGLVVPRFAARPRSRALPPTSAAGTDPRAAAVAALSAADRALATDADPRNAIGQLYRRLVSQVAPVIDGPLHETPEEVRDLHLLPMGVRPVAAQHLTRLFEEASYSSHALGGADVARAREAIQLAELDLRATRPAG